MIAFGPTDSVTTFNKGFGTHFYCFIDFETDSVLIRERYIFEDSTVVKTGFLNDIEKNKFILAAIKNFDSISSDSINLGDITSSTSDTPPRVYCGLNFFVEFKNQGVSRHFYTNGYTIESLNELMTWLTGNVELQNSQIKIDDNDIIQNVVNRNDFRLDPPPPVKTIIKFLPPKVRE
ncbi:MAG: hypothetical protein ABI663_13440 [Chryseolinea sp.]